MEETKSTQPKRLRPSPGPELYDMSVSEIIEHHIDQIKVKSLRKKCLDEANAKLIAILILYVLKKQRPIEFITNYLPHYMIALGLFYIQDKCMDNISEELLSKLAIFEPVITSLISITDEEQKEYNGRTPISNPMSPCIMIGIPKKSKRYTVPAVVDSGAQSCIMSMKLARHFELMGRINGRYKCTSCGVNGESTSYGKVLSLDISIKDTITGKNRYFYVDFTIQETVHKKMILLGQTFFQRYGCVITTHHIEEQSDAVHSVTFAVSSKRVKAGLYGDTVTSPTLCNGPSCTPEIVSDT